MSAWGAIPAVRSSSRFWNHTVKAQRPEIQLIDKHVDHPHRVVLSNVVIQIFGK